MDQIDEKGDATVATSRRTTVDRRSVLPLLLSLPALGGASVASVACGSSTKTAVDEDLGTLRQPAFPTQAPTGTQTQIPNIPPNVPADVQQLPIRIINGEFDSDRYAMQAGAVQLRITAGQDGPYSIRIDSLLQARVVRENDTTVIGLTAPPGQYTMKVNAGVEDTAVLEVIPPGGVPGTAPR